MRYGKLLDYRSVLGAPHMSRQSRHQAERVTRLSVSPRKFRRVESARVLFAKQREKRQDKGNRHRESNKYWPDKPQQFDKKECFTVTPRDGEK